MFRRRYAGPFEGIVTLDGMDESTTSGPSLGDDLGLPESGVGSLASIGSRVGGFLIDALLSAGVAALFASGAPRNWSLLVFAIEYIVFTAAFGQTPGMRVAGIKLIRIDGASLIGVPKAVIRTVLLILLIPAMIADRNGRGMHDRASDTVMVKSRDSAKGETG